MPLVARDVDRDQTFSQALSRFRSCNILLDDLLVRRTRHVSTSKFVLFRFFVLESYMTSEQLAAEYARRGLTGDPHAFLRLNQCHPRLHLEVCCGMQFEIAEGVRATIHFATFGAQFPLQHLEVAYDQWDDKFIKGTVVAGVPIQ